MDRARMSMATDAGAAIDENEGTGIAAGAEARC
jgi:hypothetical protein